MIFKSGEFDSDSVVDPRLSEALKAGSQDAFDSVLNDSDAHVDERLESGAGDLLEALQQIAPGYDITQRVSEAKTTEVSPFDGEPQYEALFDSLSRILYRRDAHHLLLVGERGVGQSLVLADFVRRAAVGRLPFLHDKRFLWLDCRHTPVEESRQRLAAILSFTVQRDNLVVCIEGFPALLRSVGGASNKASLLASICRANCRFIGLMSPHDYDEIVGDDADMLELFTRVEVCEPDTIVTTKLLKTFQPRIADRFGLTIDDDAVELSVALSANYILSERLPAKALRILHQVCEDVDYERAQHLAAKVAGETGSDGKESGRSGRVTANHVVRAVSQISGVPVETLRGIAERCDYEQSLGREVVGQNHAVKEVATELALIKAGLTDTDKPASVMLLVGQTGTGKTEMAKALARFYSTSKRLRTYTLGNFIEPHSVAGIIGVPPGYVGHDQGGRIVNDLNSDPYCVFLLDEADKAHPDVLQPFLNLFDEGWVVDQRGRRAYADRAIFVLTTNVGQRMIADMAKNGKSIEEMTARMKETLAQIKHGKANRPVFAPEFLARIKRIVVFQPLDQEAMKGICHKLVDQMQKTWREKRQKTLQIDSGLIEHIADSAHKMNEKSEGREGGRIVRKLIADLIDSAIQRQVSEQPDAYRLCGEVVVQFQPPDNGTDATPTVTVSFRDATANRENAASDSVQGSAN